MQAIICVASRPCQVPGVFLCPSNECFPLGETGKWDSREAARVLRPEGSCFHSPRHTIHQCQVTKGIVVDVAAGGCVFI